MIRKIAFGILLISFIVAGTDGTIRGRIVNIKGESLPGAQIFIQDLGIGTIADLEGNYILLNIDTSKLFYLVKYIDRMSNKYVFNIKVFIQLLNTTV